jgi:hypothetical protein
LEQALGIFDRQVLNAAIAVMDQATAWPRTTKLYDRRQDAISLDEIERIAI